MHEDIFARRHFCTEGLFCTKGYFCMTVKEKKEKIKTKKYKKTKMVNKEKKNYRPRAWVKVNGDSKKK